MPFRGNSNRGQHHRIRFQNNPLAQFLEQSAALSFLQLQTARRCVDESSRGLMRVTEQALSQGQRRRVALARLCLAAARTLWILDEPFTALDAAALQLTQALIESHLETGGMVVLTTHQEVNLAARETRRVELGT